VKKHSLMTLGNTVIVTAVLSIFGFGCAATTPTAPPYDSVVIDRSNPQKTVVEFDGACANGVSNGRYDVQGKKDYSVTRDGKTYYFSSEASRDRFMEDFQTNAQKAEENWSLREKQSS
jgi:YHS domain-containing protein